MAAIELRDVVKTFGEIRAVDGLDLEVAEGLCLGLLGPNGAGKSTTMRLCPGRRSPTRASCGARPRAAPEAKDARAEMGVVPQLDNLDIDVTVEDNLRIFARLYRCGDVPAAVDRALDLARLQDRRRDAVDELSGGMRRRLLVARGLIHEPKLVLLDEPTSARSADSRSVLDLIGDCAPRAPDPESTHYLEGRAPGRGGRADCEGKIIARGRPDRLIADTQARGPPSLNAPPERRAEVRAEAEAAGLSVRPPDPRSRSSGRSAPRTASFPTTPCSDQPRWRTSSSC